MIFHEIHGFEAYRITYRGSIFLIYYINQSFQNENDFDFIAIDKTNVFIARYQIFFFFVYLFNKYFIWSNQLRFISRTINSFYCEINSPSIYVVIYRNLGLSQHYVIF